MIRIRSVSDIAFAPPRGFLHHFGGSSFSLGEYIFMSTRTKSNYSRISLYEFNRSNMSLKLINKDVLFPFTKRTEFIQGTSYPCVIPFKKNYLLVFTSWAANKDFKFENKAWFCILDQDFCPLTDPAHLPIIGPRLTGLTRISFIDNAYVLSTSLFADNDDQGPRYTISLSLFSCITDILSEKFDSTQLINPIPTKYNRTTSPLFMKISGDWVLFYSARNLDDYRIVSRQICFEDSCKINENEVEEFTLFNHRTENLFYCYPSLVDTNKLLVSCGRYGSAGLKLLEVEA